MCHSCWQRSLPAVPGVTSSQENTHTPYTSGTTDCYRVSCGRVAILPTREGLQSVFEQGAAGVKTSVPDWSGQFEEIGLGVGLIRVSNFDTRQHFPPRGWEATGHSTFHDGSFEVFTFRKVDTRRVFGL